MSVAEIKQALQTLKPEELAEVAKEISSLGASGDSATRIREVGPGDPGVAQAMDAVFDKHRELLGRLAQ